MENANLVYFEKELVSVPYMVNGAIVPFEVLAGNQGVIACNPDTDGELIAGLTEAVKQRRGGIVKITQAEYEKKKLESPYSESAVKPSDMLRVMRSAQDYPNPFQPSAAHVVEARTIPELSSAPITAPPQPDSETPPVAQSEPIPRVAATAQELKLNVGRASEKLRLSKEAKAA